MLYKRERAEKVRAVKWTGKVEDIIEFCKGMDVKEIEVKYLFENGYIPALAIISENTRFEIDLGDYILEDRYGKLYGAIGEDFERAYTPVKEEN